MTDNDLDNLAADLATAWRSGGTIPLPPADKAPQSRADAHRIQDRMAVLIGGKVAGWKVGATVASVRQFEGHDAPLPGRIFADRLHTSPARVALGSGPGVKIECEFAMALTRDLPETGKPFSADGIVEALIFHPAFEVTASRYAPGTGLRAAGAFDGVADNGNGFAAVLGAPVVNWRGLAFENMEIEARIDGSPPLQLYSGAYRRDPLDIMVETLNDLRARDVFLNKGDCLLTGSLTLPTPMRRGQTIVARFGDVGRLEMRLD